MWRPEPVAVSGAQKKQRTLFCSDLFHQWGECEPTIGSDLIERARQTLAGIQQSPYAQYVPYTAQTGSQLESVANLNPATLAVMHGSSYSGDGRKAIRQLSVVFRDVLGEPSAAAAD